jgi:hypothetical protein
VRTALDRDYRMSLISVGSRSAVALRVISRIGSIGEAPEALWAGPVAPVPARPPVQAPQSAQGHHGRDATGYGFTIEGVHRCRTSPEVTDESEEPRRYAVLEERALGVTINYRVTTINRCDAKPGEAAIA